MLLAIDAGNSNIVFALMKGEAVAKTWRIETGEEISKQTLAVEIGPAKVSGGILGSVVPNLTGPLEKAFRDVTGQDLRIARAADAGLTLKVDQPEKVGIDRVMDALAGIHYFGSPLIVIDFGTATTFNALDKDGVFLGGAIAPGIGTALKSLTNKAAQLSAIDFQETETLIGKNTKAAVTSGAWFGALSQIEGMTGRFKKDLGQTTPVVATGGFSEMFKGRTAAIDHFRPDLTLQGLRLTFERITG